jgi:hypothetical protein
MDICSNADQEAVISLIAKMGKLNIFFEIIFNYLI